MKKSICLFLMLWLPLFTGSAWAMSTRMQLGNLQASIDDTQAAHVADMPQHPCHEMQAQQADAHAGETAHHSDHCSGSNCFACGVCIYATNFTTPSPQHFFAPSLTHAKPEPLQTGFASQGYPPALKPPIVA